MHIPDGYLSPASCAALYATSAPFWYVALRRMKRLLNTQVVPLLSVFAAFSFVDPAPILESFGSIGNFRDFVDEGRRAEDVNPVPGFARQPGSS